MYLDRENYLNPILQKNHRSDPDLFEVVKRRFLSAEDFRVWPSKSRQKYFELNQIQKIFNHI
jgi:hypothetical protein